VHPTLRAAARSAVLAVNKPVATARGRRTLQSAPRPFRLEIGGLQPRDGWVITNVNAVTRNYLDATRPWPIEDGALSRVYADNVIEHIPLEGGRVLLAEAYRCLRPGGVIRLVTPDVRAHVEEYLSGSGAVGTPLAGFYRGLGLTVEHPVDLVRIPIGAFGHHVGYVYDFESLKAELERAGFVEVEQRGLNESPHADLAGIDQRTAEEDVQMAVEATRP
jgi:predicted SAM-dependent methyltransferase